jgi:hypothetical protein
VCIEGWTRSHQLGPSPSVPPFLLSFTIAF